MTRAPVGSHAGLAWLGPNLVLGASTFNLLLCFLNTRHALDVSNSEIILVELAILLIGIWAVKHIISQTALQLIMLVAVWLIGLRLINPTVDLKIFHDIAIMYVFYMLGTLSSIEQGNRALWIIMLLVLAVGAFELFAPVIFGEVFNVWSYYVNKGVIGQGTIDYANSNLFISGNRGGSAARSFFPGIFGSHRVSSVFLEPDSLGNFAVITFAWCLCTKSGSPRLRSLLFALSAFCIVLADSRFAAICCVVMLAARQTGFMRSPIAVFLLPIVVLLTLTTVGAIYPMPVNGPPFIINDDFAGRLLFSGRLLASWGVPQWLAFAASAAYTADTGYAYFITNLGLPLALLLLLTFALKPPRSPGAEWMKSMMSVYFAASLCIGASVFTIKTAALVWFLYGTTNAIGLTRQTAEDEVQARTGFVPQRIG